MGRALGHLRSRRCRPSLQKSANCCGLLPLRSGGAPQGSAQPFVACAPPERRGAGGTPMGGEGSEGPTWGDRVYVVHLEERYRGRGENGIRPKSSSGLEY